MKFQFAAELGSCQFEAFLFGRDLFNRTVAVRGSLILGQEFTSKEYLRPPKSTELGKTIMYRDAHMRGWAYKTLQVDDLKVSVITGQGKRVSDRSSPRSL
jgi:hypothetical protein